MIQGRESFGPGGAHHQDPDVVPGDGAGVASEPSRLLAVSTKSAVEALGSKRALEAIRAAEFDHVVVWAGTELEHLDMLGEVAATGIGALGLCLPKVSAAAPSTAALLARCWGAAIEAGVSSVGVIFDDASASWAPHPAVIDALRDAPVPVAIENNADRRDHFASLERLRAFAAAVGSCRIVLDLGHAAVAAETGAILAPGEVAWIDLHDNDAAADRHWPLGRGVGAGRSLHALVVAPMAPAPLVIETNARAGSDAETWARSLSRDRELALRALEASGEEREEWVS